MVSVFKLQVLWPQPIDQCPTSSNTEWCSGASSVSSGHSPHMDLLSSGSVGAWEAIASGFSNTFNPVFKKVSCPITNNAAFRAYIGSGSSAYWMSLLFFDYTVGVSDILQVAEGTSTSYRNVTRSPHNLFEVQAASGAFQLPIKLRITSIFGEVVTMSISSTPAEGTIIDATSNFKVLGNGVVSSNATSCAMLPSLVIYKDKLDPYQNTQKPTTGSDWRQMALWSGTTDYFSTVVTPYSSDSTKTWEISLGSYGGITIGRDVVVSKKLIKSITIFIKASSLIASGSVVLKWDSVIDGYTFPAITTTWANYTLPVSSNSIVPTNFTEIGFTNLKSTSIKFYVDNMVLNLEDNIVIDNGGSSNNGGGSGSNNSTGGGSSNNGGSNINGTTSKNGTVVTSDSYGVNPWNNSWIVLMFCLTYVLMMVLANFTQ